MVRNVESAHQKVSWHEHVGGFGRILRRWTQRAAIQYSFDCGENVGIFFGCDSISVKSCLAGFIDPPKKGQKMWRVQWRRGKGYISNVSHEKSDE